MPKEERPRRGFGGGGLRFGRFVASARLARLRRAPALGENQASHRLRMWGFFFVAPPPIVRPPCKHPPPHARSLDCHAPCLLLITIPCGTTTPTPLRRARRRTRRPSRPRPT